MDLDKIKKDFDTCGTLLTGVKEIEWLIEQAEEVVRLKEYIAQLEHESNLLYGRLNNIRDLAVKKII